MANALPWILFALFAVATSHISMRLGYRRGYIDRMTDEIGGRPYPAWLRRSHPVAVRELDRIRGR